MRRIIRSVIQYLVARPRVWALLRGTVVRLGLAVNEYHRRLITRTPNVDIVAAVRQLSPGLIVRNGPFAGMKYAQTESCGSALFPKLLGSYERELQPLIESGDQRGYRAVVDVGCAEGYYAVGLARRWPAVEVYAYDIDGKAQRACAEMAVLNGVANRVHVRAQCGPSTLSELAMQPPSLIVSDCEGYEDELFSEAVIEKLRGHDFLIELHDYFDITISPRLKQRFSRTHEMQSIYSVDDIQKVHQYRYPELDAWNLHERRVLLSEWRPYIMEWLFCKSRTA